jgi:hypothetical protein
MSERERLIQHRYRMTHDWLALEALAEKAQHTHGVNPEGGVICFACMACEMLTSRERLESIAALAQLEGGEFAHRVYHTAVGE